jgi:CDP-diacylglycerol--glycerol-3-phosphate 3-phosphatidyltransferase
MIFLFIDNLYTNYFATFIFLFAALTDLYDGYLARKTNVVTNFGKFMDPLADKILTTMGLVSFVAIDDFNQFYLNEFMVIIIIVRDFFITGLRTLAAYKGIVIYPSKVAKNKTALEMVVIFLILIFLNVKTTIKHYGWFWDIKWDIYAYIAGNVLLYIVMSLSIISLIDYIFQNKLILKSI